MSGYWIEEDDDQPSISISCVWRIKATPGKKILASFRCQLIWNGRFWSKSSLWHLCSASLMWRLALTAALTMSPSQLATPLRYGRQSSWKTLKNPERLWQVLCACFGKDKKFPFHLPICYNRVALPPDIVASRPLLTLSPWVNCSRLSSTPTRCCSKQSSFSLGAKISLCPRTDQILLPQPKFFSKNSSLTKKRGWGQSPKFWLFQFEYFHTLA